MPTCTAPSTPPPPSTNATGLSIPSWCHGDTHDQGRRAGRRRSGDPVRAAAPRDRTRSAEAVEERFVAGPELPVVEPVPVDRPGHQPAEVRVGAAAYRVAAA